MKLNIYNCSLRLLEKHMLFLGHMMCKSNSAYINNNLIYTFLKHVYLLHITSSTQYRISLVATIT